MKNPVPDDCLFGDDTRWHCQEFFRIFKVFYGIFMSFINDIIVSQHLLQRRISGPPETCNSRPGLCSSLDSHYSNFCSFWIYLFFFLNKMCTHLSSFEYGGHACPYPGIPRNPWGSNDRFDLTQAVVSSFFALVQSTSSLHTGHVSSSGRTLVTWFWSGCQTMVIICFAFFPQMAEACPMCIQCLEVLSDPWLALQWDRL